MAGYLRHQGGGQVSGKEEIWWHSSRFLGVSPGGPEVPQEWDR